MSMRELFAAFRNSAAPAEFGGGIVALGGFE